MFSLFMAAFLLGMRHALEADHLAAVASLASRSAGARETVRLGVAWGVGHTLTLAGVGGVVLLRGALVPEGLALGLELAVGVMLLALGAGVIRRMIRDRVHFHTHRHGAARHFHAHAHAGEAAHASSAHDHAHPAKLPGRALAVGMVHGMAGSAALVLLALGGAESVWLGVLYILIFGAASVAGMAVLSFAVTLPLRLTAGRLTWAYNGLTAAVGLVTVALGARIVYEAGAGMKFFG